MEEWPAKTIVPAARTDGLVVERLDDETLIYDLERDEVHHLNPTAGAVLERCDGRMTVAALAERVAEALGQPADPETVWQAVELLSDRALLARPLEMDAGVSRREVVRKAALVGAGAAVAAPVIKSIVAPTPAMAQTKCINPKDCNKEPCCPGFECIGHLKLCKPVSG